MNNTIWVTPDVYERMLNDPNKIVVEAQGESPIILKVIGFPSGYNKSRRMNDGTVKLNGDYQR